MRGGGACALSDGPRSSHAGVAGAFALVVRRHSQGGGGELWRGEPRRPVRGRSHVIWCQSRRRSRCRWRRCQFLASSFTPTSSLGSAIFLPTSIAARGERLLDVAVVRWWP
uniref:Uncharacterized protein n=1 Tax=Arundo donax TaxID=35708 RepID=A0A0A8XR55_ARUDO